MAHEYLLKMIVNSLENFAEDCATLGTFLNLRVPDAEPFVPRVRAPLRAGGYPDAAESLAQAVVLMTQVVNNNVVTVRAMGAKATEAAPVADNVDEADLLRHIAHWQALSSGLFKSILRLYGERPAPEPHPPHPGPSSEGRLYAEMVTWLQKLAAESEAFVKLQWPRARMRAAPKARKNPEVRASLRELERLFHLLTQDLSQIASVLPYHLHRANA